MIEGGKIIEQVGGWIIAIAGGGLGVKAFFDWLGKRHTNDSTHDVEITRIDVERRRIEAENVAKLFQSTLEEVQKLRQDVATERAISQREREQCDKKVRAISIRYERDIDELTTKLINMAMRFGMSRAEAEGLRLQRDPDPVEA